MCPCSYTYEDVFKDFPQLCHTSFYLNCRMSIVSPGFFVGVCLHVYIVSVAFTDVSLCVESCPFSNSIN